MIHLQELLAWWCLCVWLGKTSRFKTWISSGWYALPARRVNKRSVNWIWTGASIKYWDNWIKWGVVSSNAKMDTANAFLKWENGAWAVHENVYAACFVRRWWTNIVANLTKCISFQRQELPALIHLARTTIFVQKVRRGWKAFKTSRAILDPFFLIFWRMVWLRKWMPRSFLTSNSLLI